MDSHSLAERAPHGGQGIHPSARLASGFFALAALCVIVPLIEHLETVLLLATMVSAYLGYLFFRARRSGFDWFEVFIPYGAFFILAYGGGALFYAYYPGQLFRGWLGPYLTPALLLATAAFVAFLLGYAARGAGKVRRSPLEQWRPAGMGVAVLAGTLGFFGQTAGVVSGKIGGVGGTLAGLLSAAGQFGPFFLVAWYLGWHQWWTRGRWSARQWTGFVALLVMAGFVVSAQVGTKEIVIVIGSIPIIAFWYARHRLPVRSILVLVLLVVLVVFPIYNTFRFTERELDTGTRLRYTMETTSRWDSSTYFERTIMAFLGRLAYITCSAAVLQDVGHHVDYKRGETLLRAPISVFIPRLIWPDKPNIVIGREFGETFRLVHARDKETQIAPSSAGELYWNFGLGGVLVGMFLFGLLFRWCYRRYGEGDSPDDSIRRSIYVVLLAISWHIEGGIAATLAGGFKTLILLWLFFFLMRRTGFVVPANRPAAGAVAAQGWPN